MINDARSLLTFINIYNHDNQDLASYLHELGHKFIQLMLSQFN